MMKPKQIKNRLLVILLLLVCFGALTYGTYAAFTTSGNFKRAVVARTKDGEDSNALRFSSNYLSPYTSGTKDFGTYPVSISSDSDVTIGVTVCNYPQNAQSAAWANANDITYTISMKVLDSQLNEKTESSVTITPTEKQTLTGGTKSVQLHRITIPKNKIQDISQGYIQVIVRPDDSSTTAAGNNILAANLQLIPASTVTTAWTGVSGDNEIDFALLDAYNYQISGTEQCILEMSWDKAKVVLSDWSIKTLNANANIESIRNSGSITFSVGGQDQPTSYMLQFYKVGTITSFDDLGISLKIQN